MFIILSSLFSLSGVSAYEHGDTIEENYPTFRAAIVPDNIRIKVVDQDNEIVEGATVVANYLHEPAKKYTYTTDNQGLTKWEPWSLKDMTIRYEITKVPSGYEIVEDNKETFNKIEMTGAWITRIIVVKNTGISKADKGFFGGLISKILQGLTDLVVNPLKSAFTTLIVNPLKAMLQLVIDGLVTLGNFIIDGIKTLFLPKSETFTNFYDDVIGKFLDKLGFIGQTIDYAVIKPVEQLSSIGGSSCTLAQPPITIMGTSFSISYSLCMLQEAPLKTWYDIYYNTIAFGLVMGFIYYAYSKYKEFIR